MDTNPSLPSALKRKVSDIEMCAPILQQPTPDIDMYAGLVAAPEVNPEAEHMAEDEDMDEKEDQQQKLMGTRALRFKAPSSARVQAFDMDDDDQQPEQPEQTQQVGSQVVADISFEPLLSIAMAESLPQEARSNHSTASNNDAAMPLLKTPQRKTAAKFPDCTTDVPHSPSRMVTPHRVVYSPAPPMTIINSRRTAIFDAPLLLQLDLQTPIPALVLASATVPASDSAPMLDAATEAHKSRLSSDSVSARMSTTGELEPDIEETRVPFLPARRFVQKMHILAACGQIAPIDWAEGGLQACGVLLPEIDPVQHSENQIGQMESESGLCKIGEATYSEVFSAQWRYVPRTRYDKFNSKKGKVRGERLMQVALKIIPFGNSNVKSGTGEPQTTLRDLYQEIGATLALSRLSEREREKLQDARLNFKTPLKPKERELGANFVKAFRVCICQGPLPAPLLRAWDRWKAEYPDLCENIRPDYYPPNQLFAVFVLELGGETLENANVSTWKEARSIIRQLALSMALAERHNQFEHRDLHWGNIMITRSNSHQTFLYQLPPVDSRRNSKLMSIPNYKVRCTIIDYTLSRLHIDNDANDATGSKPANYDPANNVFYVALKDESLFRGEGDIQYDVYRKMRDCSKSNWEKFHPHTNVLWLTYVLHKILLTKSPTIQDELMAFAESKLGAAFAAAPVDLKRAASQEVLRRWIAEFEQCETSSQLLKCALLDLYKS
ncbi:hypothetical protein LPJ66_004354 [Kickxella alabastrina]|uniref:Uncharacterized protein n=1 Tax=Kickxella alabastrina TaxID=61397 RepID=A0ACC1II50_9FUNG|nr:hypothetical protein LPJ66_004354 [Kickxella alabastrina]